ncbi:endonuclease [Mycoplasma sp. CR]|uniref:endonuclease n=1 Tax=Mycoplasma sp. CR TaxID=3401693 RepID=UPI003AAADEA5
MKKIKSLLISLTGLSIITLPAIATQCSNNENNNNQKPDGEKPATSGKTTSGNNTGDAQPTTGAQNGTETNNSELAGTGLTDGNNLFEMIPNAVTQEVITKLGENNTISFDYKTKEIKTSRRDGIQFLKAKAAVQNATFQLANVTNPTFTSKKGTFPNGDITFTFNKASNTLTMRYKLVVPLPEKQFKYLEKEYTSVVKLTVSEGTTTPANSGSENKDNGTTPLSELTNNLATVALPTATAKYTYKYDNSNNYYVAANGKSGLELLDALLNIQKQHLSGVKSGAAGYAYLKEIYDHSEAFKDKYYEKDNSILDIYSENPDGVDPYTYATYAKDKNTDENKVNVENGGMNREHLVPQSWFIPSVPNKKEKELLRKNNTIRNDAQFVFPTDIYVNKIRGNTPHDNVANATQTFQQGSKFGTNSLNTEVMEPLDAFKGDIARAYLYFMLTYRDQNIGFVNSIFKDKTVVKLESHYLNTYLNWDMKDVVDPWDVTRNNEIARLEQMRNPFIDYPNLAENLFGKNPKPFENKGVLVEATLIQNS